MMGCARALELLPSFLDLDLEADTERALREHLTSCRACRERYVEAEPALLFSLAQPGESATDADAFVSSVLSGVHQARFESRTRARRVRGFLALAAGAVLAVSAALTYRMVGPKAMVAVTTVPTAAPVETADAGAEPAFVEVEGEGVRLYQVSSVGTSGKSVQVAFIVDPHLEL
jgi:predicted anti-sigma-YlaC factor YlaD